MDQNISDKYTITKETVGDVINSMTEKQKNVVYYLVGQARSSTCFYEIFEEVKNNSKYIEKLSEQINDLQKTISNFTGFTGDVEGKTHLEVTVNRDKKIES